MKPLEAREQLVRFGRTRGENSFRLAMHASVPQSFRADLLHLLCLNFVPEASCDTVAETDVLLAEFCEENGGYYRFDPAVRAQLQDLLENEYTGGESRIQMVAAFLKAYTEHCRRLPAEAQDTLMRQYLEVQRWVALSYLNPESASMQLATALRLSVNQSDAAARLRISGLVSTIAQPLTRYSDLLVYAKGIEAAQSGDVGLARELLERFEDSEPEIAGVKVPAAAMVLRQMRSNPPEREGKVDRQRVAAAPIRVYISYSHKDARLVEDLRKVLAPLEMDDLVRIWHDREIPVGLEWSESSRKEFEGADLILIMVSPHYMASNYCWEVEAARAMERARAHEARLAPIVLRPCAWVSSPLGHWQGLPLDVVPVTSHRNRDKVWLEIALELRRLVTSMLEEKTSPPLSGEIPEPPLRRAENGFELCIVASHRDRKHVERLRIHLAPLMAGLIRSVTVQEFGTADSISPEALGSAGMVVVLMTPDLFGANPDLDRLIEKAEAGEIALLPVLVRPVYWNDTPLSKLQAAPRGAKAISMWANRDQAWLDVVQTIAHLGQSLTARPKADLKSTLDERTFLTDAEASLINVTPENKTVEELISIARPAGADLRDRPRFEAEKKSYSVRAFLRECKLSLKADLQLVLEGETGVTMTARVPDPDQAGGSAYVTHFRTVREFVSSKIVNSAPGSTWIRIQRPVVVEVTGVGHFTDFHGQTGLAPNGFALRPVYGMMFAPAFEKKSPTKPARRKKPKQKAKTRPKMKK